MLQEILDVLFFEEVCLIVIIQPIEDES